MRQGRLSGQSRLSRTVKPSIFTRIIKTLPSKANLSLSNPNKAVMVRSITASGLFKRTSVMSDQLPEKLQKFRTSMDEPSNDRSLDLTCHCGEKLRYLCIKYTTVKFATIVSFDADGEPIYGYQTTRAPYAYWRCINGHQETDGY